MLRMHHLLAHLQEADAGMRAADRPRATAWAASTVPAASSTERQADAVAAPSSVTLTVDLTAPGKNWGSIVVPWSDNDGAWANKLVPICVINGTSQPPPAGWGAAQTALLFAGNHGDEWDAGLEMQRCHTLFHHARTHPSADNLMSDWSPCTG